MPLHDIALLFYSYGAERSEEAVRIETEQPVKDAEDSGLLVIPRHVDELHSSSCVRAVLLSLSPRRIVTGSRAMFDGAAAAVRTSLRSSDPLPYIVRRSTKPPHALKTQ